MLRFKDSKFKLKALPLIACLSTLLTLIIPNAYAADGEGTRDTNQRLIEVTGQIQSINEELSGQRATLGALRADVVAQGNDSEKYRRDLLNELKALRRQNQSLVDALFDAEGNAKVNKGMSEVKPLRNYDLQTPDGKMYFGEDEYVYVKEADASFDARIDTGAAVSSISAKDITEFERKGRKWYRFTVEANDHNIVVEAPYVRTSIIRQVSKDTVTKRVVVELNVKIGDYATKSEFTLSDRTLLQYPLLIGRTLLQDIAVVDVSRDHIQGRNKDTFLILSRKDFEQAQKDGKDPNAEFKAKQESAAGQVAYPSQEYGANLGTNSENALPVVRNKDQGQSQDAPAKAVPVKSKTDDKAKDTKADAKTDDKAVKADNKAKADTKTDAKAAKSDDKAAKSDDKAKADAKSAKSDDKAKDDAKADAKDAKTDKDNHESK